MVVAVFFQLLTTGLWENNFINEAYFPISDQAWKQIYRMSQEQSVCGLIYRGICYLPKHLMPSQELMIKFITRVDSIERRNRFLNKAVVSLQHLYNQHAITAILQKGQGVASMYEKPLLRECGDLDYYLSEEDIAKMRRLVEKKGITVFSEPDGSERYTVNGVYIENHRNLIDIHNYFAKRRLRKILSHKKFEPIAIDEDNQVIIPEGVVYLIMLNTHILNHALGNGVGLRQLCDMARAYSYYRDVVDFDEYYDTCQQLHIYKWTVLLDSFLCHYLHLEAIGNPIMSKKECHAFYRIVMDGGNFGFINRVNTSVIKRKLNTFKSFVRKADFSFRYSFFEYGGLITSLFIGQFKRTSH